MAPFLIPPIGLFHDLSGPNTLADLIFGTPVIQAFSTTAAGFAAAVGDAVCTPSYIHACDDASGALTDSVGSADLAVTGTPLYSRKTLMYNGGAFTTKLGVERSTTGTSSEYWQAASSAVLDSAGTSIGGVIVCRQAHAMSSSNRIAYKKNPNGYQIYQNPFGSIYLDVTGPSGSASINVTATHDDGSAYYIGWLIDTTSDTLRLFTPRGESSVSIAGVGSLTNTLGFLLGGNTGATMPGFQILYNVGLKGAAAEALTKAKLDAWWLHATDPTGLLTTSTRGSALSLPVADGYVCHYAPDTIALGWDDGFSGDKFGLACNSAITNLQPYSEDVVTGWTNYNCTPVNNSVDAPDGFRSAGKIAQTASGGRTQRLITGLTASTEYTVSYWARTDDGGHDQVTYIYNNAGSATIVEETTPITDSWTLVEFQFTTEAGQTQAYHRIHPGLFADTDKSLHVWGIQTNLGNARGFYARTDGGAASLVASVNAAPFVINTAVGEIAATWIAKGYVHNTGVYNCPGSANANRRRLYTSGTSNYAMDIYDSTGAAESHISRPHGGLTTEHTHRYLWDQSASGEDTGGYESVSILAGSTQNGEASPFEGAIGGIGTTTVDIGLVGTSFQGNVLIQRLTSYAEVNGAIP